MRKLSLSICGVLSDHGITIRGHWMKPASLMECLRMRVVRVVNDERAPAQYAEYAATFAAFPQSDMLRRSQFFTPNDPMPNRRNPSHHLRLLATHAACDDPIGCTAED